MREAPELLGAFLFCPSKSAEGLFNHAVEEVELPEKKAVKQKE